MSEFRQSLRQLRRSPAFTAAAVITLTLAVAAATTVFSIYNAVIYRPSRAMDWEHVFVPYQATPRFNFIESRQAKALRANTPEAVEAVAARTFRSVVVQSAQRAVRTYAEVIDGDLGATFRIRPIAGRLLDRRDDVPGVRSAVVSEALWRQWFGGRDTVDGTERVRIAGADFEVVGVMPPGIGMFMADVWISVGAGDALFAADPRWSRTTWWTYLRARPGISESDLSAVLSRAVAHVPSNVGVRDLIARKSRPYENTVNVQVFGISALLLVAACANLTNLFYARITQRRPEIAVRLALGAGRLRIIRGFVFEIIAITVVSAAAAYTLALGAMRLVEAAFPTFRRNEWGLFADMSTDSGVILFASGAAAATAIILSIIAAATVSRADMASTLAVTAGPVSAGAMGRRFRYMLVWLQVTVAVALVLGAGLWLLEAKRSIDRSTDFSAFRYVASQLATLRLDMTYQKYSETHGALLQMRALDAAARVQDVEDAALASGLPGAGRDDANRPQPMYLTADTGTRVLSGRAPAAQGNYAAVSPRFLETIELPVIDGREFRPTDASAAPLVTLVSESVATMLFPGKQAVGERILFSTDKRPREIVGVFRDPLVSAKDRWMVGQNIVALVPLAQHYRADTMVVVRSKRPAATIESVSSAVAALDPQLAIFDAASVEHALLAETAPYRAATKGMAVLGTLSLVFAAVGIYGVMSFYVSTRVREFGIRMALGATPRTVLWQVFGEARLLLLSGLLCGVFLMAVLERVLDNRIVRLMPNAIEMWIAAIVLVLVSGLIATYFPARRASRTEPNVALRDL